jgi:secreted Zn-dependent insulinase-like peptidase
VPREWVSSWEAALPLDSFTLPEPNPFLTTDFNISEPENIDVEYPEKIMKNKLGELWFKQDTKFLLPRAYIIFQLVSPIIFLSPEK